MFTNWTATLLLALPFLTSATPALNPRVELGVANYYHPFLTFCGRVHTDDDLIVALSEAQFARYPDACDLYIRVTGYNGNQIVVQIADKCPGSECGVGDIDLTPAGFLMLFDSLSVGRGRVSWDWA
ncbi:hypothetical protein Neosp_014677 [[Neocosmospora] mangrovei]